MVESDNLRYTKIALNNGSGAIPSLGFGTLIPDPVATRTATKAALEAGFRQLDAAERYRNEKEVGEAMQEVFKAGKIKREDVFIATKLWNNNHRPERVKPAFEASLKKLQLDYVDLYLIHTPFAFQPGDEQDPRDANGPVIYDKGVTLLDTWRALECLVDDGKCKAIGLSDVGLGQTHRNRESRSADAGRRDPSWWRDADQHRRGNHRWRWTQRRTGRAGAGGSLREGRHCQGSRPAQIDKRSAHST